MKQELPELIKIILKKHLPCDRCEIILTTAHKAKGLEWGNILLSNDFTFPTESMLEDEINLLYVAVTRAIHNLKLTGGKHPLKKIMEKTLK